MSDHRALGTNSLKMMNKEGIASRFVPKYGKPLSAGYTSEVYRHEETVIKVYSHDVSKNDVYREAYINACVKNSGINVPDILGVREEFGFLLTETKFIPGKDMFSYILTSIMEGDMNTVRKMIEESARLHVCIHQKSGLNLPDYTEFLKSSIMKNTNLDESKRLETIDYLDTLPKGNNICHGDYHPQQLLYTEDGKFCILDWADGGKGNPASDAARTYMNLAVLPPLPMLNGVNLNLHTWYLDEYLKLTKESEDSILSWLPVHAAVHYGIKQEFYTNGIKQWLL